MTYIYEVRINGDVVFKGKERKETRDYVDKTHGEIIQYYNYDTFGVGKLEVWENGINKTEIVERRVNKVNVLELLENYKKNKYIPKEINISRVIPCTPKRTRIKIKKNSPMETAAKDKKIKTSDGQMWVSKRTKDGSYKWEKYYEKNYTQTGRKSPKLPAKNFKEGERKKGLDGKFWVVKTNKNGTKKWIKT